MLHEFGLGVKANLTTRLTTTTDAAGKPVLLAMYKSSYYIDKELQGSRPIFERFSKWSVAQTGWNISLIFRSEVSLWSYAAGDITI